jgi:conjugal transfer pilus assembly protein TraV
MLRDRGDRRSAGSRSSEQAYAGYRESVYRELQGLIDQPVTPMLKPARTVRTLILPYADQHRPDRLYMQRYVFDPRTPAMGGRRLSGEPAIVERARAILEQVRERAGEGEQP